MSKKEKEQKAKEFWEHYAPMQTGLDAATIEWLKEDDCWVEENDKCLAL